MIRKVNEKNLEKNLTKKVKELGGLSYKFSSPQNSGVFDRIVILPNGQVWFVELKSPGKILSPLQWVFKREVEARKAKTFVISDLEDFNNFFNTITHEI